MTLNIELVPVDVNSTLLTTGPALSLEALNDYVEAGSTASVTIVMSPFEGRVLGRVQAALRHPHRSFTASGGLDCGHLLRDLLTSAESERHLVVLSIMPPEAMGLIETAAGSSELRIHLDKLKSRASDCRFLYATPCGIESVEAAAKMNAWIDRHGGWRTLRSLSESTRRHFFGIENLHTIEQRLLDDATRLALKVRLETVRQKISQAFLSLLGATGRTLQQRGTPHELGAFVLAIAADYSAATLEGALSGLRPGAPGWGKDFFGDQKGWKDADRAWHLLVKLHRDANGPLGAAVTTPLLEAMLAPHSAFSLLATVRPPKPGASPGAAQSLEWLVTKERLLRSARNCLEHNRAPEPHTYRTIQTLLEAAEIWCSCVEDAAADLPGVARAPLIELVPQPLRGLTSERARAWAELGESASRAASPPAGLRSDFARLLDACKLGHDAIAKAKAGGPADPTRDSTLAAAAAYHRIIANRS
jgi:hypothetical protein